MNHGNHDLFQKCDDDDEDDDGEEEDDEDLYIIGAVCMYVCMYVCQQKSLFLYSKNF